ncbi:deoxyribose-phosphate aldolase [Criibacterium bergeronii]|uniref:Deoxyribose-phosphate aldolase n=1 Tax=Criibacterium bergeronii TaxID=1871336 RepID=A0A371IKI5_9FIRM|nr:deoxyribose-phosphate aldolase [Criibacterium bergeronii]MBS6062834.1 deoxyribose-phosphate aldolase [Peptostreptococcaceae bacterium]RDY21007.1 deoxyribose-phosphate aldolase [Criibacterium bergeronii]TRW27812.1 deoxyribose-phosphate aldolase [Criibacterium bergeronii]
MKLNKMIDHTILKAEATEEKVKQLCSEAKEYDFASVCVNSCYVALVSSELKGTDVKTCCVVGFPLGAMSTKAKAYETKIAVEDGADEIDMVINVGYMKAKKFDMVLDDIKAVRAAVPAPKILKVIIETCLLTDEEKVKACELSVEAKADFVKTSTGFSTGGATKEYVDLMKKAVNGKALVKASGGIRDKQTALEMVKAGADRIGASASVEIVK